VTFDDWMLALHVLAAFSYVAGVILFWVLVVAVRKTDTPQATIRMEPIAKVGTAAVGVGGVGTIVLGIWLAFRLDSYAIWDGWIIAALVLWAIGGAVGKRTGDEYTRGTTKARELHADGQTGPSAELLAINRTQTGLVMQSVASLVLLLLLLDMIFKPGA
jgi:drug/metabolite transporter (DMT)-like permease